MLNEKNIKALKNGLGIEFDKKTIERFNLWHKLFLNYNSHTNLMSKNDANSIFEKHFFDCLAITKWKNFNPQKEQKILDVGCGGGFPSFILAIDYQNLDILSNDSRIKKINFIIDIKDELDIKNLKISYARIEDLEPVNCDIVCSRAVGTIKKVMQISKKHLKEDGHFIFYKSKGLKEELLEADIKNSEIEPYKLPLKESFERYMVAIKKN